MNDFLTKIEKIQESLKFEKINGWLFYDFRKSNSLAHSFLQIPNKKVTRRFFYWIPQYGDPIKIVSAIEPFVLDHLPGMKLIFHGWKELEEFLKSILMDKKKIAMEYSPNNILPTISKVDAGTIDLVRQLGVEVVSSADLLQVHSGVWSAEQIKSHRKAARVLDEVAQNTWDYIEDSLKTGFPINEYLIQQFILKKMDESNCYADDPPTCAVNGNSADPHYTPSESNFQEIKIGDFILIDLWCKEKCDLSVYADITRVGVASKKPTSNQQMVFEVVKKARDAATLFIKERFEKGLLIQGWEVDDISRKVIEDAGFGKYFIHRTGHHLGEEVHGPGANLDNYETHDYRQLLTGTGFTIEPGIYLPHEFGVRMEYDIYLNPKGKLEITGGIQEELVCMNLEKEESSDEE